ncbi:hypothetical protein DB30_06629 [Enhygromyxa salina]|uniref:DUF2804 domain-containing protein n=1 Tax=Enhygromyxa salina TaxID=215803 RepID=A0A0C1ZAD2_9BACT|nr:DUF2804 domain-containing protein [Enhygromyxa salina]KIG14574.1 hypothetical protein DB30_06629 [Enhygromyxa salina]
MREILPAPAALVEHGKVAFGTYTAPLADTNLIDAQPFAVALPRPLRALRLKEWQAFQFGNERWFFIVALFNAKLLALAQVKVYDREQRRKHVFERKLPGWALTAPRNLLDSSMQYQAGGASIRFSNRLVEDRITIELELPQTQDMPALSGAVTALASGCEPEVVCIPFPGKRGMYSHKACLALEGQITLGDQQLRFTPADSFLLMDDHKGYYPRIMRWDWVTGGGFDSRGRRIGFNLTRNDSVDPARYNENCLWIDGRLHLLPPVSFVRRPAPDDPSEVWEIRDEAGEVEVDFVIELDGHVRVNALVIESRYRGPFGQVRGHVRGPAGERVELDGLFGMGEDFYLRC